MTRPVYEPTPARYDAYNDFGNQQLFRRPSPDTQGALIPGFHGFKQSSLTVSTGNQAQLRWDFWTIDDDTVFDTGTITGGDLTEVRFLADGWYSIDVQAHWSSEPATGFGGIVMIDDDTDFTTFNYHTQGVTYPLNWSNIANMTFHSTRCFPQEFGFTQSFAWVNNVEFWVIQNSGVDRTIDEAYCSIAYLGPRQTGTPSS